MAQWEGGEVRGKCNNAGKEIRWKYAIKMGERGGN